MRGAYRGGFALDSSQVGLIRPIDTDRRFRNRIRDSGGPPLTRGPIQSLWVFQWSRQITFRETHVADDRMQVPLRQRSVSDREAEHDAENGYPREYGDVGANDLQPEGGSGNKDDELNP